MPSLSVAMLSYLSRVSPQEDHASAANLSHARESLQALIPDLPLAARNKQVLDFGSGEGWHALTFGDLGASKVLGVDIEADKVERSRQRARDRKLGDRVFFDTSIPEDDFGTFDLILSRDSMEHYEDPESVLRTMKRCLRPGGQIIISFGPPWYSPYGAHMNYFLPIPWVHLFFSEDSIMTVRSRFRADGARRYEDVPGGLNRMSVSRFERLVRRCGLAITRMDYHAIRGKQWLARIPVLRELFINLVSCTLEQRED